MDRLIEDVIKRIISEKNASHVAPVFASFKEILGSAELKEQIINIMRNLAIDGKYKAGLDIRKQPILLQIEQEQTPNGLHKNSTTP